MDEGFHLEFYPFLLEHPLKMKTNKYLFLSICFPFLLIGGEMDEAMLLEF
jgi:hypothetical protein